LNITGEQFISLQLSSLRELKTLDISNNPKIDTHSFNAAHILTLDSLNASKCNFRWLPSLNYFSSFKFLNVLENPTIYPPKEVTDGGIQALVQFMQSQQVLDLSKKELKDADAVMVEFLVRMMPRLESVNFSQLSANVGSLHVDLFIRNVFQSVKPKISKLAISSCSLDETFSCDCLSSLPSLTALDISRNSIGHDAVGEISDRFTSIVNLNISGCNLTWLSFPLLLNESRYETINFSSNPGLIFPPAQITRNIVKYMEESCSELNFSQKGLRQGLSCDIVLQVCRMILPKNGRVESFNVQGNPLRSEGLDQLLPTIFQFSSLTSLNLSDCETSSVPQNLDALKFPSSLIRLHLSGIPIEAAFVESICKQCLSLKELHLKRTSVQHLPDALTLLTQLSVISVEGCQYLESLPFVLVDMQSLTSILVDPDCIRLGFPPLQTATEGKDRIVEFLKAAMKGTEIFKRLKLIFLGNGRGGKTSFLRFTLQDEAFSGSSTSTRGVDIIPEKKMKKLLEGSDSHDVELSCWDFAGQLEYSAVHDYFMSAQQAVILYRCVSAECNFS